MAFLICMALSFLPGMLIDRYAQIEGESGIIRVIFTPFDKGLVTFEVELNGIDVKDGYGKEVNVNWKFDDFDEEGKFFTDANGL